MKKIPVWGWAILILVVIGGVIGGTIYMQEQKNEQMQNEIMKVANSKEVEDIILSELSENDPHHKIKKLKILDETVHRSPMGGILFEGFVNDDESLKFNAGVNKEGNKYVGTNIAPKANLYKFLGLNEGSANE